MLQTVFYWVLSMSMVASLTGVVVWLVRSVKAIPRRVTVLLWGIPLLRMAVPFGVNNPYSLLSLISRITTNTVVVYCPMEGVAVSMTNCVMAVDSYCPMVYKTTLLESIFRVASIVWVTVSTILIVTVCLIYAITLLQTRDAVHLHRNVYQSERVVSPSVCGIFRPKILLPMSYARDELVWILRHERVHIRRGDNLWRLLALLTVAVHWFNPLAWMMLSSFYTDLEQSCDETVVAKLNVEQRKAYAHALLNSKEQSMRLTSAFGGADLRLRIEHILSFKRMTWISGAACAVLLVSMCYVLLTNAG